MPDGLAIPSHVKGFWQGRNTFHFFDPHFLHSHVTFFLPLISLFLYIQLLAFLLCHPEGQGTARKYVQIMGRGVRWLWKNPNLDRVSSTIWVMCIWMCWRLPPTPLFICLLFSSYECYFLYQTQLFLLGNLLYVHYCYFFKWNNISRLGHLAW